MDGGIDDGRSISAGFSPPPLTIIPISRSSMALYGPIRIRPTNRVTDVALEQVYPSAPWQHIDPIDPIDRLVLNG